MSASQLEPSLSSPSLTSTTVRQAWPRCWAARALPTPKGRAWPRLPVLNSTPGTLWLTWFISRAKSWP